MDKFFIVRTMTRTVQKEEPYEYKYLDLQEDDDTIKLINGTRKFRSS
jgi:hypothetical protein